MRMSDEPSIAVETVIKADANRIYEVMSDLDAMASFGTEFQGGEWVTGRPGTVGSTFRGRNRLNENEWETTSTIIESDSGKVFAWKVGDPDDHVAIWRATLRSVPEGTEVNFRFTHGPGQSGLTSLIEKHPDSEESLIDSRLQMIQENMVKTLEGIRRRTAS